jgi:hypothetical protein
LAVFWGKIKFFSSCFGIFSSPPHRLVCPDTGSIVIRGVEGLPDDVGPGGVLTLRPAEHLATGRGDGRTLGLCFANGFGRDHLRNRVDLAVIKYMLDGTLNDRAGTPHPIGESLRAEHGVDGLNNIFAGAFISVACRRDPRTGNAMIGAALVPRSGSLPCGGGEFYYNIRRLRTTSGSPCGRTRPSRAWYALR